MNNGENAAKIDILLVENNPVDISRILASLKKANICNRIHVLGKSSEILEFLFRTGSHAHEPPLSPETLILLSLNLEDTPGLDVLRKLKSDERSKSFPVIVLTSSQEDRGVMESYKLGANACIVKPLDIAKFIEAISELRLGWFLVLPDEANGGKSGPVSS